MKLSIVTTLYKSSPYLVEFYNRVIKQANKHTDDFEIIFVNSELNLQINQELIELLLKISKGGKISEDHVMRISKIQEKLNEFTKERTLSNQKDLDFVKEISEG